MWNFIALFLLFKWAYLVENVFVEEKKNKITTTYAISDYIYRNGYINQVKKISINEAIIYSKNMPKNVCLFV
jgi:Zn/Cd-binding protein ZinT